MDLKEHGAYPRMVKHIEIPEPQAIPLYEVNSRDGSRTTPDYRRHGWAGESVDFGDADRGSDFQRLAIEALDKEQDEPKNVDEEASTWKLVAVTIALCFAMFCVSLVSGCQYLQHPTESSLQCTTDNLTRTGLFLLLQFPKLPMPLARWTTWAGMVARTSSPTAQCSCYSASCTPTTPSNGSS